MTLSAKKVLCFALALPVTLLLGVAPSSATVIHNKIGSFTGSDAPGGPFGVLLSSDAVDQSNGDVYVTESGAFGGQNVVDKFNEAGEYAGVQLTGPKIAGQESFAFGFFPGVAVDNSTGTNKGDVYVADSGHHAVDRFSAAGTFLCEITGTTPTSKEEEEHECNGAAGSLTADGSVEPAGVAVDAAGEVYVADDAHAVVDKFSETGEYLGQIRDPHISNEIGTVAIDKTGNLYVSNLKVIFGSVDDIVKFDAAGAFVSVLDHHNPIGVGADPHTGNIYVDEFNSSVEGLVEYDSSGAVLDTTPVPGEVLGIAVDGSTGKIYASGLATGSVSIFSGDVAIPTVAALPATAITETSATLNGHLDPDTAHDGGEITGCEFEWGETSAYGQVAPCTPGAPYAAPADVKSEITGLEPGHTYHFRVKATNANGTNQSADETMAAAGAPAIDRQSSRVDGVGAVLTAQINPFHFDTTCQVEYVNDMSYKASGYATAVTLPCSPQDLGSSFGDVAASATLTGLSIGTTYHYRFLASSEGGLTGGRDRTFLTFGVHGVTFELLDKEGAPFTQAGGHPYELRTDFAVNWTENVGGEPFKNSHHPEELPTGNIRTVVTDLPAGLIGNPSAAAKCARADVIRLRCSNAAQVGVLDAVEAAGGEVFYGVYNLVPPEGVTAEFGVNVAQHFTVYIDARLRPNGDYALTAESQNNSVIAGVTEVALRLWGVPADPSHDQQRCPELNGNKCSESHGAGMAEAPLLFTPTSCGAALTTVLSVDSYQAPGSFDRHSIETPPIAGCGALDFGPTLQVAPTSNVADTPTGLHVDLHIPQQPAIEDPATLREADLRDTVVTLPRGLTINPAAASGLEACSSRQVGLTSAVGVSPATFSEAPAGCPRASKVGTVEVDTPLLSEEDEEGRAVEEAGRPVPHVLHGAVYIASPYDNPFGSLFAIYIVVEDPKTGVVIKLPGRVEPDAGTGQLTTTFTDSPQLPFEDFKLDFFSGPRATLATPETCGSYAASTSLTPWSGGAAATPAVPAFGFTTGCVSGFAPTFTAGTISPQAGAYSPLTLSFQRGDSDQELSGLTVNLPPGLLARVGVQKCSDAELAAAAAKSGAEEQAGPSCPAGSLLGTVQAGAGAGESPFFTSGKAYLTGPYKGGPYGVAVVVPAVAGPFDLGTVVVRTSLHIDPTDGHVTAISDPFPTVIKGVPLRMRRVTLTMDRPQFTFNPTSCDPLSFTGALTSTGGSTAPLAQRFQAAGCQGLPFKPRFSANTSGHTSRANGASLTVKVAQSPGEADIHKVDLQLPLDLPARLTTLNKACTEAQFDADPSGCPAASNVGTAKAITPVLSVPLSGPAYLVSHGGAAFPDLEYVLQGEGVKIVLDGKTDIKNGITYSHFGTVPDAPISSFETTLPEGPHSILGAIKTFCGLTKTVFVTKTVSHRVHGRLVRVRKRVKKILAEPLLAPTTITAQNGAVVRQTTKIAVTGCSAVPKTAHRSTRSKRKKK